MSDNHKVRIREQGELRTDYVSDASEAFDSGKWVSAWIPTGKNVDALGTKYTIYLDWRSSSPPCLNAVCKRDVTGSFSPGRKVKVGPWHERREQQGVVESTSFDRDTLVVTVRVLFGDGAEEIPGCRLHLA